MIRSGFASAPPSSAGRSRLEIISSPPDATLRKIIAAGRTAESMPPKAQALLARI
jgi:hypothetical protein